MRSSMPAAMNEMQSKNTPNVIRRKGKILNAAASKIPKYRSFWYAIKSNVATNVLQYMFLVEGGMVEKVLPAHAKKVRAMEGGNRGEETY